MKQKAPSADAPSDSLRRAATRAAEIRAAREEADRHTPVLERQHQSKSAADEGTDEPVDGAFIAWLERAIAEHAVGKIDKATQKDKFLLRVERAWREYKREIRRPSQNKVRGQIKALSTAANLRKEEPKGYGEATNEDTAEYEVSVEKAYKNTSRRLSGLYAETRAFLYSRIQARHGQAIAEDPALLLAACADVRSKAVALGLVRSITETGRQVVPGRHRDEGKQSLTVERALYAPEAHRQPPRRSAERAFAWRLQIAWLLFIEVAPAATGEGAFYRLLDAILNHAPCRPEPRRRVKVSSIMDGFGRLKRQGKSAPSLRSADQVPFGLYMSWHEGGIHFAHNTGGRIVGVYGAGFLILECDEEDNADTRDRLTREAFLRVDAEMSRLKTSGDVISKG